MTIAVHLHEMKAAQKIQKLYSDCAFLSMPSCHICKFFICRAIWIGFHFLEYEKQQMSGHNLNSLSLTFKQLHWFQVFTEW